MDYQPSKLANEIRIECLRMTNRAQSSHLGSMFSCADIVAVLYSRVLKFNSKKPKDENRDFFFQSKGHAGGVLYATLAKYNFFDRDLLKTYYQNGSKFGGHISHKGIPGVELSTGSLGHALSVSCGVALELKNQIKENKVFTLLSDGEMDEGSNWEALMFAGHHNLNNLTIIIDYNKLQSLTSTYETLNLEPLEEKLVNFGWEVLSIDGHNYAEIEKSLKHETDRPLCIIANTTKGKGVSFMEDSVLWHYRSPQGEEFDDALNELEALEAKE